MQKITGRLLAKRHKIQAAHALYRSTGDWYHVLRKFPAALFDDKGYLYFENREQYENFTRKAGVQEKVETNTLRVDSGIVSMPGYQTYNF